MVGIPIGVKGTIIFRTGPTTLVQLCPYSVLVTVVSATVVTSSADGPGTEVETPDRVLYDPASGGFVPTGIVTGAGKVRGTAAGPIQGPGRGGLAGGAVVATSTDALAGS